MQVGEADREAPDRRRALRRYRLGCLRLFGGAVAAFAVAVGLLAATGYPDTGLVSDIAVLLIGGSLPFAAFALLFLAHSVRMSHAMRSNPWVRWDNTNHDKVAVESAQVLYLGLAADNPVAVVALIRRRQRFTSSPTVWLAAPPGRPGVIASGDNDLAWFRPVSRRPTHH